MCRCMLFRMLGVPRTLGFAGNRAKLMESANERCTDTSIAVAIDEQPMVKA